MSNRIITLSYRKVIDAESAQPWEKMVFEDSYQEFRMQFQYFNQRKKYNSFAALMAENPGAGALHFLVSAAVTGYIRQLNGSVPDILCNSGKRFLTFSSFRFEIINSDMSDIKKHQVAIHFFSQPLQWHETIGSYLLVSDVGQNGEELQTDLFQFVPFLNIHTLKK